MTTQKRELQSDIATDQRSRFTYHGDDDPGEGGVQSVRPQSENHEGPLRRSTIAAGTPGPAERLLDISELARTIGMRYTHRFAFPPNKEDELNAVTPTVGVVTMTNAGAALILTGKVSTTLRLECGRCLTPMDQVVESDLDEQFDLVAKNNAYNQEETFALDEDSPAAVIAGNVLNLADLLRQNLLLAAPLQPLCREDCPGIVVETTQAIILPLDKSATPVPDADNPLRRLADLLEEKRRRESQSPS